MNQTGPAQTLPVGRQAVERATRSGPWAASQSETRADTQSAEGNQPVTDKVSITQSTTKKTMKETANPTGNKTITHGAKRLSSWELGAVHCSGSPPGGRLGHSHCRSRLRDGEGGRLHLRLALPVGATCKGHLLWRVPLVIGPVRKGDGETRRKVQLTHNAVNA